MKNKFKKILAITMASVLAIITTGCGSKGDSSSAANGGDTSKKLTINGSTSMEKVVKALNEAFASKNNGVTIDLIASGSGTGIQQAGEGRADIGASSRKLKATETGLKSTEIAIDGVAVITNKDIGIDDISLENLTKIYQGEIKNWKDIGGADKNIVVIGREEGSGTRDAFESIVTGGETAKAYAQNLESTGAIINAVATTTGAIGYASLANVDDSVLTVKIDGVAPTDETIKDGSFKVQRPFLLVTKEGNNTSLVKEYIDFVLSDEGQEIVNGAGLTIVT